MNPYEPSYVWYDPASPSAWDHYKSLIDDIDRHPSAQTCDPRFLDLDEPAHLAELPLSYDEVIPAVRLLKEAI